MEKKQFELKLSNLDAETGMFEGIGNKTGFKDFADDIVVKGAFQKSISRKMPKLLWQHKSDEPIGIFTEATEDGEGLKVKGQLLMDVQRAREAHALLKAGAIDGLSIGFSIPAGGSEMKSDGTRLIKEVNLHEVSIVTFPCNSASTISSVKSVEDMTEREFEKSLRDVVGLSQKQAKALISGGYAAMNRDDSEQTKSSDAGDLLAYLKTK
jgi:hypothetical protein